MLQELMLRIRQLETHVKVLQRASKEENPVAPPMPRMAIKRKKKFRPSDFNKYVHHVALTIMYLGHDYTGYDDTEEVVSLDVRGNLLSRVGVKLMEEAGKKLIGEYDFRNFCKFNVKDGITNYVRKIMEVEVKTVDETDDGFTMCELTIVGRAFLWHQIRSIFSVLFLVGKGKESVEVVDELLNIEKNPRKPQYNMSSDAPLCLYDADFGGEFEWIYEAVTLDEMIASHESRKQRWRENAEIEAQDDSSEEEMTSRKRQRLEIDKPSHIDDKPFGTLDKPKSGENKDPHIIYGENNKGDDDTVRDIDGETTNMKADKDICDSKTSLKDNGEENLETSENGMKGEEKVGRSTQEEIGESSVISNDTDQFDREYLTTNR
ncbi:PUS3-like protein, partial [Mya arenaria]